MVVLTGENGAGKTNLLEAVSLLTPGRGLAPRALRRRRARRQLRRLRGPRRDGRPGRASRDRHRHCRARRRQRDRHGACASTARTTARRRHARMAARAVADAGDGRAVHRPGRRPPPLPRPAGAGDRSRPWPPRAGLRKGDARRATGCSPRVRAIAPGSTRSRRRWSNPASPIAAARAETGEAAGGDDRQAAGRRPFPARRSRA